MLREQLQRAPRRPGIAILRELLEAEPALPHSHAEELFLELIRTHGLPPARINCRVCSYVVDFLWPAERLIVEIDGYEFHADARAFHNDRRRDLLLTARGYRVVRITWQRLVNEPDTVIRLVRQALNWSLPPQ